MKQTFTKLFAALALLVSLAIPMGVWGQTKATVTDNMTAADLAATGTSYTAFSNVSLTSDAVYAGKSALNNNANIQLRSSGSDCGIVSTVSGGKIKSITINVASGSNTIDVYGKNTAYTGAAQLYNATNQGTKLGSVSSTGTITVSGDYEYVGIRSYNGAVYISSIAFVWETTGSSVTATTVTIDDSGISNTDVYTSTTAGSLSATVKENTNNTIISGAAVTWSSSNTNIATIDNSGAVTLVAAGTTTITASYAGESGIYGSSSATYVLTVTSSEPYVQPTTIEIIPNYEFWGKTGQFSGSTYDELNGSQDNVSLHWTRGNGSTYANLSAMRFYKDNNLTFTAPEGYEIISIELSVTGTYDDLTFDPTGFDNETTTWTGAAETVTMSRPSNASSYATISKFIITLGLPSTDPSITANGVTIPYYATSGSFNYTINNPVQGGYLTVDENVSWISDPMAEDGVVIFNTETNPNTVSREGIIRMRYNYHDEILTHNVTITQTAAPVTYTTIPALFEAATSTAADVTITFGNWVISAVHNSNAYLTDNQGHGLIIYASNHGFQVNDVLTGTANCKLQTYRGSAELTNLTNSTEGLNVVNNGTVAEQNIAINSLGGVNTGALLAYQGLTYNGTALVDGNNNTITPYSTLYSYTFEEGKTYNVKGIYLQYNNTKEILPRSAADIEEVVVTTPIINAENVNIAYEATSGEIAYTITNPVDGQNLTATTTAEWISNITVASDKVTFATTANDGNTDRTATITLSYNGASDKEVTVTQGHYVAPVTGDKYVKVTSTTDLTSGQYLIVYEEGSVAFNGGLATLDAVGNTIEVTLNNNAIAVNNATTAAEFTIDMTAGTIKSASGYYIGRMSDANGMETSTTEEYENAISIGDDGANIVSTNAHLRYNSASNQTRFRYYKSTSYTDQKTIQLYKKVVAEETYTLEIAGYGNNSNSGGWYLIASPINVNIDPVNAGMITDSYVSTTVTPENGTYDLYSFNQSVELEWENYRVHSFALESGKGYLYANKNDVSIQFAGTPYNSNGVIPLVYDAGKDFAGWNLVGNPFTTASTINLPYYKMNDGRTALTSEIEGGTIAAMEGVFVYAYDETSQQAISSVTFTASRSRGNSNASVNIDVMHNGANIDNAIVRFDEGRQLPKYQLFENSTKLYIPKNGKDYAIVSSEAQGEMPVNFKAEENGTYTLNIDTENVEMNYLHLIDNMTGMDVDLLQTPSYTFDANTNDYTSRFRLVFSANNEEGSSMGSGTFAFFSNGNWVVDNEGEATLQVIDVNGRIVSNETINGTVATSINATPGVYMLRLVNGNEVKTQKIVVR